MLLIYNKSTNPAFNLALEEYALTEMADDILMLWRNDKAVIIGKNQNALEEVDRDYLCENGIQLIRRLSGGGAVYHDLGNINYTMIHKMVDDDFNNYAKFTKPVCDFLGSLGLDAKYEGRNDILLNGIKISGNAQVAKRGRFMHHGTLLYDVDFTALSKALKPKDIKLESKGVKSVRSRVTNIAEHLGLSMTAVDFMQALYGYFANNTNARPYALKEEDLSAVNALVDEKYGTWQWNFGSSPRYGFKKRTRFDSGIVELHLDVQKGVIEKAAIFGDFFGIREISELEALLIGIRHDKSAVLDALLGVKIAEYISGLSANKLAEMF